MKLGVLSDTHGQLRPQVFPFLEGVDRILHAGDVGDPEILVALEAIAPVTAVWGNTDGFDIRHRTTETAHLEVEGVRMVVTHGHTVTPLTAESLSAHFPDADLVVYGHTHEPRQDQVGSQLILNPGSCGPRRFGLPVTLATVEIDAGTVRAQIHPLPID